MKLELEIIVMIIRRLVGFSYQMCKVWIVDAICAHIKTNARLKKGKKCRTIYWTKCNLLFCNCKHSAWFIRIDFFFSLLRRLNMLVDVLCHSELRSIAHEWQMNYGSNKMLRKQRFQTLNEIVFHLIWLPRWKRKKIMFRQWNPQWKQCKFTWKQRMV